MTNDSKDKNGGVLNRLKGLVWVVGAIAMIFAVIYLAPVISHQG
jgi:hypothetical protein